MSDKYKAMVLDWLMLEAEKSSTGVSIGASVIDQTRYFQFFRAGHMGQPKQTVIEALEHEMFYTIGREQFEKKLGETPVENVLTAGEVALLEKETIKGLYLVK